MDNERRENKIDAGREYKTAPIRQDVSDAAYFASNKYATGVVFGLATQSFLLGNRNFKGHFYLGRKDTIFMGFFSVKTTKNKNFIRNLLENINQIIFTGRCLINEWGIFMRGVFLNDFIS